MIVLDNSAILTVNGTYIDISSAELSIDTEVVDVTTLDHAWRAYKVSESYTLNVATWTSPTQYSYKTLSEWLNNVHVELTYNGRRVEFSGRMADVFLSASYTKYSEMRMTFVLQKCEQDVIPEQTVYPKYKLVPLNLRVT